MYTILYFFDSKTNRNVFLLYLLLLKTNQLFQDETTQNYKTSNKPGNAVFG